MDRNQISVYIKLKVRPHYLMMPLQSQTRLKVIIVSLCNIKHNTTYMPSNFKISSKEDSTTSLRAWRDGTKGTK